MIDANVPTRASSGMGKPPGVGGVIGGYWLDGVIGIGGMGTVYRATDLATRDRVAIKMVRPQFAEGDGLRRFAREQRILRTLIHENIVRTLSYLETGDGPAIIMEHVDGVNLREKLRRDRLSLAAVLKVVAGTLRALIHAHGRGVVHRDVKPENILICSWTGAVKLADFGLARLGGEATYVLTGSYQQLGTLIYMAPEQRKDAREVDGRADLWSVGVVLYEMLTGETPDGAWQKVTELNPDCPRTIDDIIARSLQKNPERRYRNAEEMLEDVLRAMPPATPPRVIRAATPILAPRATSPSGLAPIRPSDVPVSSVVTSELRQAAPGEDVWPKPADIPDWSRVVGRRACRVPARPRFMDDEVNCAIVAYAVLDALMACLLILDALL